MGYYITVERNVNIFVEDVDPGHGKPILFIHGWPVNHKMFEFYTQRKQAFLVF